MSVDLKITITLTIYHIHCECQNCYTVMLSSKVAYRVIHRVYSLFTTISFFNNEAQILNQMYQHFKKKIILLIIKVKKRFLFKNEEFVLPQAIPLVVHEKVNMLAESSCTYICGHASNNLNF